MEWLTSGDGDSSTLFSGDVLNEKSWTPEP